MKINVQILASVLDCAPMGLNVSLWHYLMLDGDPCTRSKTLYVESGMIEVYDLVRMSPSNESTIQGQFCVKSG